MAPLTTKNIALQLRCGESPPFQLFNELFIIKDADGKTYYVHDNYFPEDEEIEEYDDILIYYHIDPQYRDYIASKVEMVSKCLPFN